MVVLRSVQEIQTCRKKLEDSVGFVPTMGALHEGHLKLLETSKQKNKFTILSIFVNPLQFNEKADFINYPKTIDADLKLAESAGADFVFLPNTDLMYSERDPITLTEKEISGILEGQYRPGHFNGVLTVVLKLFNLVQPTRAYFGEKDYQQLLLIQKMAKDLFLQVEVVPVGTVRDSFGLALSSRNSRLSPDETIQARSLNKILIESRSAKEAKNLLIEKGFKVDYVEDFYERRLAAVFIRDVRLIDNVKV